MRGGEHTVRQIYGLDKGKQKLDNKLQGVLKGPYSHHLETPLNPFLFSFPPFFFY